MGVIMCYDKTNSSLAFCKCFKPLVSDIWPPSSTELCQGVLEAKVNATRHNTKEELRLAIKVAIEGLNKGSVANDGSKFRARLKKVIGAEGDHLE